MNTLPPSFVGWLTCTHARFSEGEMVLCLDEKTNLQPRPRLAPTLVARPALLTRLKHEDQRKGALHGCASCDARTGKVYTHTATRKRQVDFIAFLSQVEREMPKTKTQVHLVLDNLPMHKGKQVLALFAVHPHLMCHFVPVHCSWMKQVEQWESHLQRKRLRISDFSDLDHLAQRIMAFVSEWNAQAHPFNWLSKSAARVMAKSDAQAILVPAA